MSKKKSPPQIEIFGRKLGDTVEIPMDNIDTVVIKMDNTEVMEIHLLPAKMGKDWIEVDDNAGEPLRLYLEK